MVPTPVGAADLRAAVFIGPFLPFERGKVLAAMLGSAFLVEAVYAWPGLSRYGVAVILRKDLNAITGTVLVISAVFLIVNLIVDLLVSILNPRIRLSQRAS